MNKIKQQVNSLLTSSVMLIFIYFFSLILFFELLYAYYFPLNFHVMKLFFVLLYSLIFTAGSLFCTHRYSRNLFLGITTIFITILYFGEASYFNLFKSFALWDQLLRVDELAGIMGTLGEFIERKFLFMLLPLLLLLIFFVYEYRNSNKGLFTQIPKISLKQKCLFLCGSVLMVNTLSLFSFYVLQDNNKLLIKNTTEYVRNYSLIDAFFINSIEPVIKPLFKGKEVEPEVIERVFGISKSENEMTNKYESKNLIFVEAESIAPYAIDPILTPTLYQLKTEGYDFDNYYSSRTNTFASEYAILNSFYLTPEKEVEPFSSKNSMPGIFRKEGYSTQAFHNFMSDYYSRDEKMSELGFDAFYGSNELNIHAEQPDFPSDIELFENSFQYLEDKDNFLAYYVTVSAHGGYNSEFRPRVHDNLAIVEALYPEYDEKVQTYLAAAMITDQGIENLYMNLEKSGKLDDTIIVLVGDHYPYAIDDAILMNTFDIKQELDLYKVPMIIWDVSQPSQVIDSRMSNVDILPTLANLFNVDLKYGMGKDIFSDQKDEIFIEWYDNRSYSFMTAHGGYDYLTGETIGDLNKEELKALRKYTYRRAEWNNSEYLRELLKDD